MACRTRILEPIMRTLWGSILLSVEGYQSALGFLKEDHSRTQISGSNLKDKGFYLILKA